MIYPLSQNIEIVPRMKEYIEYERGWWFTHYPLYIKFVYHENEIKQQFCYFISQKMSSYRFHSRVLSSSSNCRLLAIAYIWSFPFLRLIYLAHGGQFLTQYNCTWCQIIYNWYGCHRQGFFDHGSTLLPHMDISQDCRLKEKTELVANRFLFLFLFLLCFCLFLLSDSWMIHNIHNYVVSYNLAWI